jgi:hypothetical protein
MVTGHRPFLTHVPGSKMVGGSVVVVGTIPDILGEGNVTPEFYRGNSPLG